MLIDALLPMDTKGWDFTSITQYDTFQWHVGTTPFSDLWFIVVTWGIYFATIITLKLYMKDRQAFKLSTATALHNAILCLASLFMFVLTALDIYKRTMTLGVSEIFFTTRPETFKGRLVWIMYIYYLSKYQELLDTVILVLKKKPVIFLHWYHHAVIIFMVWTWLEYKIIYSALGMLANTLVHVFMYYYYSVSSMGREVWFKKYLTSGQIIQFIMSFVLSIPYVYYHWTLGQNTSWKPFLFSMSVNGSFLFLFIRFYQKSYSGSKKSSKSNKKE
ncbi:very-long-chain 3-oxoacyl-CoA synthase [Synchytrium microbalum]|uniref:Elongation of fatty acids protein n=1 Tax=Synchytrium microbalum TaxID=1806994 RepID=A0A507C1L6_9FUNG|nr:very-long-chain 3-oxoacyl-CoA synthase [Synchytrium microbalum]TPX31393.1 very-long-chain 3-oxoacyl-CoA synthase [Synchytrium microbalum]